MGVASMKKWYVTVALLAGWLSLAGTASAQIPTQLGAARIPEPLPCGPTPPQPNLVPGPIDPSATPPVPESGTEFRADHTSAFQCEEFSRDDHCFFNVGSEGWMRQKLGSLNVVSVDPGNIKNGVVSPGTVPFQTLNDISQDWNFGVRASAGYVWQNETLEFTGFWIPQSSVDSTASMPGQLDLPFANPPLGFEGDNGMWTHADRVETTFKQNMFGGEINYRYNDAAIVDGELILGVRYFQLKESLGIFTGDDDLTFPTPNGPDPTRQATYQTQTVNQIIAPQIGFEIGKKCTDYFTLGITGKAAAGVNFIDINNTLTRGDGFVGFNYNRHELNFSQIYETGAFIDFNILERLRLRMGYNAMFLVGVAPAADQVDFNLEVPGGNNQIHSTIFYHGPMAEFQFLF
jgi:hypothetical protein